MANRLCLPAVAFALACSDVPPLREAPGPAPDGTVWVPGGEFEMGDDGPFALAPERPVHRVRVDGFFMDVNTVTNSRFARFVEATGYVTVAERAPVLDSIMEQLPPGSPKPSVELLEPGSLVFTPVQGDVDLGDVSRWWRWVPGANWRHPEGPGNSIEGKEQHPVVQIAWEDAAAFATWAGGRLPTEAEWEYAARGGLEHADYSWGNEPHDLSHPQAHIYEGSFPSHSAESLPVGTMAANGYGLHDMAGNVWQWTSDWFAEDTYARDESRGTVTNPVGASGARPTRVIRGGSFLCSDEYCRGYRVSARGSGAPDTGASHIGFRVVMTAAQYVRRSAR